MKTKQFHRHNVWAYNCVFWILPLFALVRPALVDAQFFSTVTSSNTAMITGYYGTGGAVAIPSTIGGRPVTVIEDNAFKNASTITSITLPNTLTTIGNQAFNSCTMMVGISIPTSVTSIGYQAFYYCISLASITIPSSVTMIGYYPFDLCSSLTNITVDPANTFYSSGNGALFDKNQSTFIVCPGGTVGTFSIPDGVTTLSDGAFGGCGSITEIFVPKSVISIGNYMWNDCYNLKRIWFRGNCPTVGVYPFYYSNPLVYYLPGMTGWGPTFGGLPTALWRPQLQAIDPGQGAVDFAFYIYWASGMTVEVDACTNLAKPVWVPQGTWTLSSDTDGFADFQWMNYPRRFYRVRMP